MKRMKKKMMTGLSVAVDEVAVETIVTPDVLLVITIARNPNRARSADRAGAYWDCHRNHMRRSTTTFSAHHRRQDIGDP